MRPNFIETKTRMISNTGISPAAISIFVHISHRICANIGMKSGHGWEGGNSFVATCWVVPLGGTFDVTTVLIITDLKKKALRVRFKKQVQNSQNSTIRGWFYVLCYPHFISFHYFSFFSFCMFVLVSMDLVA